MNKETPYLQQLTNNILYFPGHANITVLNLGKTSLMIECGRNIVETAEIRKQAENILKNKIKYVAITHFHSDHTHSMPLVEDCQIIASKKSLEFLKAAKRTPVKNSRLIFPNTIFENQFILKEGNFEVIIKKTGGHTADSSYIYSSQHKLLATGDNLRSDFLWGGRGGNPEDWISALKEYVSLDPEYIIIGHGEIMTKDEVSAILSYVLEVNQLLITLSKESLKESEILPKIQEIKPHGKFKVFIHESTVIQWCKYYLKNTQKG
ncbi:MBL fold metallo-hydrolase [Candidatus Hodarchaeum mangrovi]